MKTTDILTKLPKSPNWLDKHGRSLWAQLGKQLIQSGILSAGDITALELLCQAYSEIRRCDEGIRKDGYTIDGGRYGKKMHPAVNAVKAARTSFFQLATHFGLTPKSRKDVEVSIPEEGFGLRSIREKRKEKS